MTAKKPRDPTLTFQVSLPDGTERSMRLSLPRADVLHWDPNQTPAVIGKAMVARMLPSVTRQIAALLPPAAPARKEVHRDASGRIVSVSEYPATRSPSIVARQIAEQLAPHLAAPYEAGAAADLARQLRPTQPEPPEEG